MERFLELLPEKPDFPCSPGDHRIRTMLREAGCEAEDWDRVLFSPETDPSLIRRTRFLGAVRVHLPRGIIRDACLKDCSVAGPAEIISCSLIQGYAVLRGTEVSHCGVLSWSGPPGALASEMHLGEETGLRSVPLNPVMDHAEAFRLALDPRGPEASRLREALEAVPVSGTLGPEALVTGVPKLQDTLVLSGARLDFPGPVTGSVLLPGSSVANGAQVHRSVLQWRASADTMALVTDSVAGEGSVVERHGLLSRSFLGADSVLGEGEMTASLAGPFTAMHHQSLLIAALWPAGRGNVGYGANAGSNHTSRLPDQELRLGEGFFIGLGVSVKFPADYSRSPYSILATGITTLPQKVCFPFSLISQPAHRPPEVPEGFNRILPGWVLTENLYSLARNSWKYRSRATAVHTPVSLGFPGDDVVEMTREALERLRSHPAGDMPGAGKNFLTEEDRLAGISAYETMLEALDLYHGFVESGLDDASSLRLRELLDCAGERVTASRMKDHSRGAQIIEDYGRVRTAPEEESFLRDFHLRLDGLKRNLESAR
jgi:hypothetical protein